MSQQRNNNMNNKLSGLPLATPVRRRRNRRSRSVSVQRPITWSTPPLSVGNSSSFPGRAKLRSVVEVYNGAKQFYIAFESFNEWFGQARSVLTPYKYFRVADLTVEAMVAGGSASPNAIAFNVSNAVEGDGDFGAVMNDDFSGLCTAMSRPVLHPYKDYWRETQMKWYIAADVVSGAPTDYETVAGCISCYTSGGATSLTIAGWLVVTMEIEYHTLA